MPSAEADIWDYILNMPDSEKPPTTTKVDPWPDEILQGRRTKCLKVDIRNNQHFILMSNGGVKDVGRITMLGKTEDRKIRVLIETRDQEIHRIELLNGLDDFKSFKLGGHTIVISARPMKKRRAFFHIFAPEQVYILHEKSTPRKVRK